MNRIAETQGWASIFINIILFGLKLWAGLTSRSVAVLADAWHTLSDSLTSIIVIISARVAGRPPDEKHPFGHGRIELISSIIIGVLLLLVGINFFSEAVGKLRNQETAIYGILTKWVFIISVLFKEAIAQFAFWAYKKTGNRTLKADGWHHRSDSIASAIILVGIFAGNHIWWLDSVLGIIVSLLIIYTAAIIIKEGADPLLGEKPEKEMIKEIQNIADYHNILPDMLHHWHIHKYGSRIELTFHACFDGNRRLCDVHREIDQLELSIRERLKVEATVHADVLKQRC